MSGRMTFCTPGYRYEFIQVSSQDSISRCTLTRESEAGMEAVKIFANFWTPELEHSQNIPTSRQITASVPYLLTMSQTIFTEISSRGGFSESKH